MNPKIVVHRTHIDINDYRPGDSPAIENSFVVKIRYNQSYYVNQPKGIHYDASTKTLKLPRGTSIERLEKLFNCVAMVDYSYDPVRDISPITLKYTPRDDDQKEAIKFILGMGKYKHNEYKSMLALNLNTGKGKT